jgi:hypothetical protein
MTFGYQLINLLIICRLIPEFFREDKSHLPHPDYGFYELERKVKAEPS